MNILFIGHEADLNGASRSLLNLISILENNHNIYVLTSFNKGAFYEALKQHNVQVLVFPYYRWCVKKHSSKSWIKQLIKWNLKYKYVNMSTAKKIAEYAVKNNIDIIHSNTGVVNVGALISKFSKIKHVWHIREFGDMDFNMYPLVNKNKYYKEMNNNTDAFICISKAIYNHYKELDSSKKHIIYNGVDNKNFISAEDKIHSDTLRILIAGRVSEEKGQKQAVKACEKLISKGIDNFVLYIAGAGNLDYEISEDMLKHIKILGLVSDMPELRKKIDVELVCSKAEAFGRTTAEAMMGGIPVIGSNTGGTVELIKDGETGFLYEYGNIDDLSEKIEKFIVNPMLVSKMGLNAKKYAESHFTIERCADEIMQLYQNL